MKESVSEPTILFPDSTGGGSRPTTPSQSQALKAAIQIQVQAEALTTTAQAAAKQARLLTQYVSILGQVGRIPSRYRRPLDLTQIPFPTGLGG
jgi:hypothetical protein